MENATSTDYCRGYEGLIKQDPEERNDQHSYKMGHQSKQEPPSTRPITNMFSVPDIVLSKLQV